MKAMLLTFQAIAALSLVFAEPQATAGATIKDISKDGKQITVAIGSGKSEAQETLKVTGATKVLLDGKAARVSDLAEGQKVTVTYDKVSKQIASIKGAAAAKKSIAKQSVHDLQFANAVFRTDRDEKEHPFTTSTLGMPVLRKVARHGISIEFSELRLPDSSLWVSKLITRRQCDVILDETLDEKQKAELIKVGDARLSALNLKSDVDLKSPDIPYLLPIIPLAFHFCNQLSLLEGRQPYYEMKPESSEIICTAKATGYRLLSKSEWVEFVLAAIDNHRLESEFSVKGPTATVLPIIEFIPKLKPETSSYDALQLGMIWGEGGQFEVRDVVNKNIKETGLPQTRHWAEFTRNANNGLDEIGIYQLCFRVACSADSPKK